MKFKRLIPALAMLLVSAILLGTSTFAWFSMNREVTATGMQVKAVAGNSLQISDTTAFVSGTVVASLGTNPYSLYHAGLAKDLVAAESSDTTGKIASITNPQIISPETGLATGTNTALFEVKSTEATTTATGYYKDYIAYIAAEGSADPINEGKLTVTIAPVASITENALNAVTVAVIYNNTYMGKINLKDGGSVDVIADLSSDSIPSAVDGTRTESDAKAVTLRVYLDGQLEDAAAAGKTYVRTSAITNLDNSISFDAVFNVVVA